MPAATQRCCLNTGDHSAFHPMSSPGVRENHIWGFYLAFLSEEQVLSASYCLNASHKMLLTGVNLCIILDLTSPYVNVYI